MPNIEIKARYPNLDLAQEIAQKIGAKLLWSDDQEDTYFSTRTGQLKLRESRVNGSELIPYIKSEDENTKRSDYAKLPVTDPALVKSLLNALLGAKQVIRKHRKVFLVENVRVHLDSVDGLGNFLEFEAVFHGDTPEAVAREKAKLKDLMSVFQIVPGSLLEGSYPDLLA